MQNVQFFVTGDRRRQRQRTSDVSSISNQKWLTDDTNYSMIMNRGCSCTHAELAELVDALDSGSSVRKDFRVQVPGSAFKKIH